MYKCINGDSENESTRDILSIVLNIDTQKSLRLLIKDLEKRGARKQLLMFLSGRGGSGKSYTIYKN